MATHEKTIVGVFEKVTTMTDSKIDDLHLKEIKNLISIQDNISRLQKQLREKEQYNQSLPKAVGIDLTEDVSELNRQLEEQHRLQQLKENYFEFVQEKEALKIAFAPIKALVMNKQVFHDLTEYFGLVRLYEPPKQDNVFCVKGDFQHSYKDYLQTYQKNQIDNQTNQGKYQQSISLRKVVRWSITAILGILISLIVNKAVIANSSLLIDKLGFGNAQIALYSGVIIACTTIIVYGILGLLTLGIIDKFTIKSQEPFINILFPKNEVRSVEPSGYGTWTYFKITLPKPPQKVKEKIITALKLYENIKNSKKGELCTVADPYALTIELVKTHTIPDPIPPRDADPGVVIEYGHFAVILPETFYNITPLEAGFLDEAIARAETWDIKKYLLN